MKWGSKAVCLALAWGLIVAPVGAQSETQQQLENLAAEQQQAELLVVENQKALHRQAEKLQDVEKSQAQSLEAQGSDLEKSEKMAYALTKVFDLKRQLEQMNYSMQSLGRNLEALEKLENVVLGEELDTRRAFMTSAEEFGQKARLHLERAAKELEGKLRGHLQGRLVEGHPMSHLAYETIADDGSNPGFALGKAVSTDEISDYLRALADRARAEQVYEKEKHRHAEGRLLPLVAGEELSAQRAIELQAEQIQKVERLSSEMAEGLELARRHRAELLMANLTLKQAEIAREMDEQAYAKALEQSQEAQAQATEQSRVGASSGSDSLSERMEALEAKLERIEQMLRKLTDDK